MHRPQPIRLTQEAGAEQKAAVAYYSDGADPHPRSLSLFQF